MSNQDRIELDSRIDKIEASYEFMLAYAAQGLEATAGTAQGQEITTCLNEFEQALNNLSEVVTSVAEQKNAGLVESYRHFIDALDSDSKKTKGAIRLVLAQDSISSQLIDNLNASIHLRALLTDLFVFDEALA